MTSPNIISRTKASSHPTPRGGMYVGVVRTITPDGKYFVYFPKLDNTIGPIRKIQSTIEVSIGTQVLCTFTNANNDSMFVIGSLNSSDPGVTADSIRDVLINSYMTVNE